MSVMIASGGLDSGGAVFETTAGTKCSVFAISTGIVAYKDINGTPSLMDGAQSATTVIGTAGTIGRCHAAMDSNDDIHVIVAADTAATRDISYNILSGVDSTPSWGTWEEAAAYTNWDNTGDTGCAITIDSSDAPHVSYIDDVRDMGVRYQTIRYTEKTGASWATPQTVTGRTEENDNQPRISVDSADDVHFLYKVELSSPFTNQSPVYRFYNGTFGTEDGHTVFAGMSEDGLNLNVRGATPQLIHGRSSGPLVYHGTDVDTSSSTTFNCFNASSISGSPENMGLYTTADDDWIIYIDDNTGSNGNVDIIKLNGSWGNNQQLQGGTYQGVIVGWSFNNLNNTTCIQYLFTDQTDIWWDEFCFTEDFHFAQVPNPVYRM